MVIGRLEGLYSGKADDLELADGKVMRSAVRKQAADRLFLHRDRLEGNESALADHHTPDKIVHFFNLGYYPTIGERLGMDLSPPTFGENFSTSGFADDTIFVGDVLSIGDAIVRVTQPTERCKIIGKSLGNPKILKVLHELQICGFYAHVVEIGEVWRDSPVNLLERPQKEWSIARLHRFMFDKHADQDAMEEVQALPQLSGEWKARVLVTQARKIKGEPVSSNVASISAL